VFIVSTPNKRIYHDEARDENPFHVSELYFEEFQQLLGAHFKNVGFLGQRIHPSSSIWPIGTKTSAGFEQFVLDRGESEFEFIPEEKRIPLYYIGIASDSSSAVPPASVLFDHSDGLMKEAQKAIEWREEKISSLEGGLKWREEQLGEREKTISAQDSALKWREEQIRNLEEQVQQLNDAVEWTQNQITHMEQTIASHEEGLAWRAHQVESLEKEKAVLTTHLQNTQRQLGIASQQLDEIHGSRGWKFILKLRHFRDRLKNLIGPGKSRG
jgi:O-antigen biosynthesis protein